MLSHIVSQDAGSKFLLPVHFLTNPVRGSWAFAAKRSIRFEGVPTLPEIAADGSTRAAPVTARTAPLATKDTELRRQFEHTAAPLLTTLHRIARRMTGNAADAEDLLQDTMVKAYIGFPALQAQTHMKAWFVRIMRNIWIDDYRRSQRPRMPHRRHGRMGVDHRRAAHLPTARWGGDARDRVIGVFPLNESNQF